MIQDPYWWLFVAFLPVIYWWTPARARPALVAVASFVILAMLAPFDLLIMLGIGLAVYGAFALSEIPVLAPAGQRRSAIFNGLTNVFHPRWLVILILGYLFWYKYRPPIIEQLDRHAGFISFAIPLGISYFSFKLIHYVIERGRGMLPPHTMQDFLSWLFLMPTFTSGPIERFEHFLDNRQAWFSFDYVVEGGTRIAQGLVKKFIFADPLTRYSQLVSGNDLIGFSNGNSGYHGVGAVWVYLALDLLISYLDFSAYSDIAIGASRLFGFKIMENFNYPLSATNLIEFWRRWHMTLTNWCRAYIYMPMIGQTRNPYAAMIATFVVVGLWHAGSVPFLAWGIWHGVGQAVVLRWSRFAQQKRIFFFRSRIGILTGWVMTMAYVMLGGAFELVDRQGGILDSFRLIGRALGL